MLIDHSYSDQKIEKSPNLIRHLVRNLKTYNSSQFNNVRYTKSLLQRSLHKCITRNDDTHSSTTQLTSMPKSANFNFCPLSRLENIDSYYVRHTVSAKPPIMKSIRRSCRCADCASKDGQDGLN